MAGMGVVFAVPKDEELLEWLGLELVLCFWVQGTGLKLSCQWGVMKGP